MRDPALHADEVRAAPVSRQRPRHRHRRARRVTLGALVSIVILLVGAAAFAGTMVLGGSQPGLGRLAGGDNAAPGGVIGRGASGTGAAASGAPASSATSAGTAKSSTTPVRPSAATPTPPSRSVPARTSPVPGGERTTAEAAVLALVNTERRSAGCAAVTGESRLATAARKHSEDMAARNYFAHTTPEGVTMATRISNAGYTWSMVGENIAAGQPDPTAVMRAWMDSPGHRANILNCRFTQLGVGVAYDARRRPIWTQDFGTPR